MTDEDEADLLDRALAIDSDQIREAAADASALNIDRLAAKVGGSEAARRMTAAGRQMSPSAVKKARDRAFDTRADAGRLARARRFVALAVLDGMDAQERMGITGIWFTPEVDTDTHERPGMISIESLGGPKRFMRVPLRDTVAVEWGWTLAEDAVCVWQEPDDAVGDALAALAVKGRRVVAATEGILETVEEGSAGD